MATTAELKAFAEKTAIAVPTIDYQVGVPAGTVLKSFLTIGLSIPGVIYNPLTKTLHIKQDGVSLSGYNFGGVTVSVEANNVTLKNSAFDASHGVYSVIQAKGKAGLTVEHSSFDGLKLNKPFADFIHGGDGFVKISYNSFKNAPSDAIQLKQGIVDHNFISGGGYQKGAHADAISIDGANGKITITNNFIDYRNAADAPAPTTSALAIGNYFGSNQDIIVQKNILLGGAYTVYVQDFGKNDYAKVEITGNIVGAGTWGDIYPMRRPDELVFQNDSKTQIGPVPVEAKMVMAASLSAPAPEPAPSQTGEKIFGKAGVANELLKGTAANDWIYANGGGDMLEGGGGRDFMFGGKGTDIFVYRAVADSAGRATDVIGGFEAGVDKIDLKALSGATQLSYIGEQAFNGKAGAVNAVKSGGSTWVEVDMNGDRAADMRIELKGLYNLTGSDFILGAPPAPALPQLGEKIFGKGAVGNEMLQGTAANDWIYSNGGGDVLVGGGGRDFLFGGRGTDTFMYRSVADSTGKNADVIAGFEAGVDRIDLKVLSESTPLSYIGEQAFNGQAGAVHAIKSGDSTWVEVDMNGDRAADLRIELKGMHTLSGIDFIL